jgi:glucosylceramidase
MMFFALYFSKYLTAYKKKEFYYLGCSCLKRTSTEMEIIGKTLISREMTDFVQNHLGPKLENDGWGKTKIFGYMTKIELELKNGLTRGNV